MTDKDKKDSGPPAWVRNMRNLMEAQQLNPRSLSLRAGLNATAVRDMIEGRSRFPRYDTVQALADVLGTTPAFLMSDGKTSADIASKGDTFGKDIELLTEIIARLQETAAEDGRILTPREFAAMSATLYRRMIEPGDDGQRKARTSLKPQIHDLLNYENLRTRRGKG